MAAPEIVWAIIRFLPSIDLLWPLFGSTFVLAAFWFFFYIKQSPFGSVVVRLLFTIVVWIVTSFRVNLSFLLQPSHISFLDHDAQSRYLQWPESSASGTNLASHGTTRDRRGIRESYQWRPRIPGRSSVYRDVPWRQLPYRNWCKWHTAPHGARFLDQALEPLGFLWICYVEGREIIPVVLFFHSETS